MSGVALGIAVLGAVVSGCDGGGSGGGGGDTPVSAVSAPTPTGESQPAVSSSTPSHAGNGNGNGNNPKTSEPAPTEPAPTEPAPTEPAPTEPAPTPTPTSGAGSPGASVPMVGMNLNALTYYTPEWVFVDVFKASSWNSGFPWDMVPAGSTATLDAQGYPKGLASGQAASTLCLRGIGGHYPGGTYTVLFDGDGQVAVGMDAAAASKDHNGVGTARFTTTVTPGSNGIQVRILRSNATNHVRNIRVIQPGFEATYLTQPFHPLYLERLRSFSVLRFMDWGDTNNHTNANWATRKRPDMRSQFRGGCAYEHMIQLANTLGKDPWICIPHLATDDYVRNLAVLVRDRLAAGRRVYLEWSNECWNGGFSQSKYVQSLATSRGTTWYVEYTRRAVECFKIFEATFGGRSRMVRVLAGQSGNTGVGKYILEAMTSNDVADAYAIAPYFGGSLGKAETQSTIQSYSVDQVIQYCKDDIERLRAQIRTNRDQAAARGLTLIAYEGGQHMCGVGTAVENTTLTNLFHTANRDPRMAQLHRDYLAMWKAEGGGLFVAFNFVYVPQKWGCWGALEYMNQPATPKFTGITDVARSWATAAGY